MESSGRQQELHRLRRDNRVLALLASVVWAGAAALGLLNVYVHPPTIASSLMPTTTASSLPPTTPYNVGSTLVTTPVTTSSESQNPAESRDNREKTDQPDQNTQTATTEAVAKTTLAAKPLPDKDTLDPPPLIIAAGGDVLGDRGVGAYIDRRGGQAVFDYVRPFLETAQLAFVNLEGPVSDKGARASWKEYTFRARPALIDGLVHAGIDMVSLANNHALDWGPSALLDTFTRLEQAGICYAGAGKDAKQAASPAILVTPAGTVAFFAFTNILPGGFAATKSSPGVNPLLTETKAMRTSIGTWRKKVDYVIVSFHWGTEYKFSPDALQQQLAHQAIDAGADLVLGHHPHVIQGLEVYKDRLIVYSLGDFVWDHYSRETGETFVVRAHIPKTGLPSAEIVPVYLDEQTGVPKPVENDAAERILHRLQVLCADLGLELMVSGSRAWVGHNPAAAAE
ncbi:MAG: CapA family protein [Thermoleophilia bacterium]|nr:CapA family protein [Thermoleophilia bacterium]